MTTTVRGTIVRGLRAASGASRLMRRGTIALQLDRFRALIPQFDGFFDGLLHIGTLNVEIPRRSIEVGRPALHVCDVNWERGTTENFYLSPCVLRFSGRGYRGLIYIPDPATKPHGLPVGQVLEVLTTRVPFIRYGSPVAVTFDAAAVALVRRRRASSPGHGRPRRR